jgi:hypothetical protein
MEDRRAIFRFVWPVVLLALVGWQGWLTLQLFGPEQPWQRLLDDQPILSGRHPLHLYHGLLGAASMWRGGGLSCFDPAFQAGYPKTPVFDGGSRPAELFLSLEGGKFSPSAYKIGLAICCCAVPLLLAIAGHCFGLSWAGACLSAVLGMLVWWGGPCRCAIEAGDMDVLLAVLAVILHAGLLLQFHRSPSWIAWLGLLVTGSFGWFAQPLLFLILSLPLLLVYYHGTGGRHALGWHLALALGLLFGVTINAFWLPDWVEYWSLRVPLPVGERILIHRTLQSFWECPSWGGGADRLLAMILLAGGAAGVGTLAIKKERVPARMLFLGTSGLLALALVGVAWEPLGRLDTPRLIVAAMWLAIFGTVHAIFWLGPRIGRWTGAPLLTALGLSIILAALGWLMRNEIAVLAEHVSRPQPLTFGPTAEQRALIEAIQQHTTPDARILWEDQKSPASNSCWTALLPLWTCRSFVGGLDPTSSLEHAHAGLGEQQLAGQPLADWSDADLASYCQRYNLGWIVCRSATTTARIQQWCKTGAGEPTETLTIDGAPAQLFTLHRERSFVLKGQGRWLQADCAYIVLGDVVPEDGKVVLSLHYQAGMQVFPSQVQIEKDPDPLDPVPFVRLRVPSPVARVILKWQKS